MEEEWNKLWAGKMRTSVIGLDKFDCSFLEACLLHKKKGANRPRKHNCQEENGISIIITRFTEINEHSIYVSSPRELTG